MEIIYGLVLKNTKYNIICPKQKYENEKRPKFRCSSILEIFLVEYIYIFLAIDTMFSTLTKNTLSIFKLEKRFRLYLYYLSQI